MKSLMMMKISHKDYTHSAFFRYWKEGTTPHAKYKTTFRPKQITSEVKDAWAKTARWSPGNRDPNGFTFRVVRMSRPSET